MILMRCTSAGDRFIAVGTQEQFDDLLAPLYRVTPRGLRPAGRFYVLFKRPAPVEDQTLEDTTHAAIEAEFGPIPE